MTSAPTADARATPIWAARRDDLEPLVAISRRPSPGAALAIAFEVRENPCDASVTRSRSRAGVGDRRVFVHEGVQIAAGSSARRAPRMAFQMSCNEVVQGRSQSNRSELDDPATAAPSRLPPGMCSHQDRDRMTGLDKSRSMKRVRAYTWNPNSRHVPTVGRARSGHAQGFSAASKETLKNRRGRQSGSRPRAR